MSIENTMHENEKQIINDDSLIESYDYRYDDLLRAQLHSADRAMFSAMFQFGIDSNQFGKRLTAHQFRVAREGARLLRFIGFSKIAAINFKAATLFHDIGKINDLYKPQIWTLKDRPTSEQKALQKRHAALGADMWQEWCVNEAPEIRTHPHYTIRRAVTKYHHERIDGNGPEKLSAADLPVFIRISCIVDAYDGDRIKRPHQPKRRTPKEALRRMMALDDAQNKYEGAFDVDLLTKYVEMKEQELDIRILQ